MDVMKAIRSRRSIRAYNKRVEREKLMQIFESARLSPCFGNRQERRFVKIKDANKRKLLCEVARNQSFVAEAPTVIAAYMVEPEYVMSCRQA